MPDNTYLPSEMAEAIRNLGTTNLDVTGAAVGDLIKVGAVDANGKPTAWVKLTPDAAPTQNSQSVALSGGIYNALNGKANLVGGKVPNGEISMDVSGGVASYAALQTLDSNIQAGTQATSQYHLGFYRDGNGDLWQTGS